jgi:hypothetical protein
MYRVESVIQAAASSTITLSYSGNSTQILTATFPAAGTVACVTFTSSTAHGLAVGEGLVLKAGSPMDSTLADISWFIPATAN